MSEEPVTKEYILEKIKQYTNNRHPNGNGIVAGAEVDPGAYIASDAIVGGGATIGKDVKICDKAIVWGNIIITGEVIINQSAFVRGELWIFDKVKISGRVDVIGINPATLRGNLKINGSGAITLKGDYSDKVFVVK